GRRSRGRRSVRAARAPRPASAPRRRPTCRAHSGRRRAILRDTARAPSRGRRRARPRSRRPRRARARSGGGGRACRRSRPRRATGRRIPPTPRTPSPCSRNEDYQFGITFLLLRTTRDKRFSRSELQRLGILGTAVGGLHLAGWSLFVWYARSNPALAGLGTLAYTFGLR